MGNDNYLIPANSKKSMLILGFFNHMDLIIFGTGVGLTFIFMMAISPNDLKTAVMILLPALISSFLILPIPHHHNVRTFIANIYSYFSKRRTYYWKGWFYKHGKENK